MSYGVVFSCKCTKCAFNSQVGNTKENGWCCLSGLNITENGTCGNFVHKDKVGKDFDLPIPCKPFETEIEYNPKAEMPKIGNTKFLGKFCSLFGVKVKTIKDGEYKK